MAERLITIIIGARPQFIKHQPLQAALENTWQTRVLHTGQHYDHNMSDIFFEEMGIRKADVNLNIGSGSHGAQTGNMLAAIEADLQQNRPDVVIVYGDTNSTMAGALAAVKLHIPVAHIEAGLRSFNRSMPEEINRVVTDHVSELLFIPSQVGLQNLKREGVTSGLHVVGDIMVDAVQYFLPKAQFKSEQLAKMQLTPGAYYYATIHRPHNTDTPQNLQNIIQAFQKLDRPVVFPVHPRTDKMLQKYEICMGKNILKLKPQGYLDNLMFLQNAHAVLTDSGGLQKEAFYVKTPCITIRPETEWVETVERGWNRLLDPPRSEDIIQAVKGIQIPANQLPVYGKGDTAGLIEKILAKFMG